MGNVVHNTDCGQNFFNPEQMKSENLAPKCLVCGAPMNQHYKPFCSKHCADVDLNRWFTGNYVIHTNEEPTEEDLIKIIKYFEKHVDNGVQKNLDRIFYFVV